MTPPCSTIPIISMTNKKLYRVKPSAPLHIKQPTPVSMNMPEGLVHVRYGFGSFADCLKSCHPNGVESRYQQNLEILIQKTDHDEMYCAQESPLRFLDENGALCYFLAVLKERENTVKVLTKPELRHQFCTVKLADKDLSLQTSTLGSLIFSSCQAFFDYDKHEYIFLNESCHHHFLLRSIYTPGLYNLIQEAKAEINRINQFIKSGRKMGQLMKFPKHIRFKTLVWIIKNHLKMRTLGWTLSEADRDNLQYLCEHEKPLMRKIDAELGANAEKFSFTRFFKDDQDFSSDSINVNLLLKKRHVERVEYLVFNISRSLREHANSIDWLYKNKNCPEYHKQNIFENYVKTLLINLTPHQIDAFIILLNQINPELPRKIKALEPYLEKERTPTSTNSPLIQTAGAVTSRKSLYGCFPDNLRPYKHSARFLDEANPLRQRLIEMGDPLANRDEAIDRLLNDEYLGSDYRVSRVISMIMVYFSLVAMINSQLEQNPSKKELSIRNSIIAIVLGLIYLLTDELFRQAYAHAHEKDGRFLYRNEHLRKLKEGLNEISTPPALKHHHGIAAILLFLEPSQQEVVVKYYAKYLKEQDSHPATRMILYVSVVIAPACRLTSMKLTHEKMFDLLCAIAEHLKIKSIHDIWTHKACLVNHQPTHNHARAFNNILEHIQLERPFNETLKRLITDFSSALASDDNALTDRYEAALPTLVQFVKGTVKKAIEVNDPVCLFWVTTDPIRLIQGTEMVRQGIVADFNAIAAKKDSKISDQLPNMSYASLD